MIKLGRGKLCREVNESVCTQVMFSHPSAGTAWTMSMSFKEMEIGQCLRLDTQDQFPSIHSREKAISAEYRTSSVLILGICEKSFNHHKDLRRVPLVDAVNALVLPLSSACQPAATHSSAKAAVYCQKSFGAVCLVSSPLSGVLSIVCKSSNQHAQILFNFTASRVALISSNHLDCWLFKSNGWVLWMGGGGVFCNCLKSPVSQQIIQFAFQNKERGCVCKHIHTAVLCCRAN